MVHQTRNVLHKQQSVSAKRASKQGGITLRAVLIGVILLIITAWVAQYSYYNQIQASFDSGTMPSGQGLSVAIIIGLVGVGLSKLFKGSFGFSSSELATIYIMLALGGSLMGLGLISLMVSTIPAFNVSLGNPSVARNLQRFYDSASPLVVIKNDESAMAYFAGLDGMGLERIPWVDWVMPIMMWTLFYGVVVFLFICLTTLVRREWVDHQHLAYPLAVPVVDVVTSLDMNLKKSDVRSNQRGKKFWIGFAITVIIGITKTINYYYPVIPAIPTVISLGSVFNEPPWNALAEWPRWTIAFHPLVLGMSYLLPLNMIFSLWFFGGLTHMYRVLQSAQMWGWDYNYAYRYSAQGAYVVLAIYFLWSIRSYIKEILLNATSGKGSDESEPLSYRMAVFGGVFAFIFLVVFMVYLLPFKLVPGITLLVFWLVCALTFSRIRAETGAFWMMGNPYWTEFTWHKLGNAFLGNQGKYGPAFLTPWSIGTFSGQMASIGDYYRIADDTNISKRKLSYVLLLAFVVAVLSGSYFTIKAVYNDGIWMANDYDYTVVVLWAFNAFGLEGYVPPTASLGMRGTFIVIGIIATTALMLLKRAFLWWPFEPLAMAAAFSGEFVAINWGSFVVIWFVKFIMYRYFGSRTVKENEPFFIGLLLGYVIYTAVTGFVGINSGWM